MCFHLLAATRAGYGYSSPYSVQFGHTSSLFLIHFGIFLTQYINITDSVTALKDLDGVHHYSSNDSLKGLAQKNHLFVTIVVVVICCMFLIY